MVGNEKSGLSLEVLKVYENLPGMYLILSADLNMIAASYNYLQNTGKKRKDIIGKNIFEVFPSDASSGISQSLSYVLHFKKEHQIPVMGFDTPGLPYLNYEPVERHWKTSHTPVLREDGEIDYIIHFTQDVTELVESRKHIEHRKDDFSKLNMELVQANEEIRASNEELISSNEELKITQHDLSMLNADLERRVSARTYEMRLAQAEAEQQRERLKRFFMQSPVGICVLDGPQFIFELVNPLYQELFPGRKLLGIPFEEALPEIRNQGIVKVIQEVYRTGNTFEGKGLLVPLARNGDGPIENRYFNFIYQARLDPQGKIDGILAFAFEVTDMVTAEQKLEKNEKHLEFLLNALPQQVWTSNPDGSLNYVNNVTCEYFGYDAPTIVDEGWQKFIHQDDLRHCIYTWLKCLETLKEFVVEFRLKRFDGTYVWHLGRAIPFIEDGQVKMWLGTNTNIDSQKSNEQKKDEFISIASHELKTPLTSIKAFNQLMQRSGDANKMKEFLSKSQQNIVRLEQLIGDLLDVTKINAGKMNYASKAFSFKEMLTECVEASQFISPHHEIVLAHNEDVIYNGDRFRIEQVVNNFLSNAVKYSPEGGKIIVNSEIQYNSIIVSVQDFGIGIAQQELNKLFDRYYRVDNTAMRFEGLGLGLFISSEILKRHQGSFWLESELGKGSIFYFRLPLSVENTINPVVKHNDFYRDQSITVSYNGEAKRLDVDWTGYQNLATVQKGGMIMLDMLAKNACYKVSNDNSHVLGTWSEASDWAREEWFPMMQKAGLKYFAWIYSPTAFSQLSAQKAIDVSMGNVVTQFFTDVALAEKWLDDK